MQTNNSSIDIAIRDLEQIEDAIDRAIDNRRDPSEAELEALATARRRVETLRSAHSYLQEASSELEAVFH
jgi:Mg2+ and Co2+ transporter CorA